MKKNKLPSKLIYDKNVQKDIHMCPQPYYEISAENGAFWIAHIATSMGNGLEITQKLVKCWNEHDILKEQLERSKSILQSVYFMFDNYEDGTMGKRLSNEAKEILNNLKTKAL